MKGGVTLNKKIDAGKMIDSLNAVNKFKRECFGELESIITADVIVTEIDEHDEMNAIHHVDVEVQIGLNSNVHRVHIMWEDVYGEDYKDLYPYLWGTYNTNYYEMNYSYHQLSILLQSDNKKIIIRKL